MKALSVIILLFLVGTIPLKAVPWSSGNFQPETNRTLSTAIDNNLSNSSFILENSWRNFEPIHFNLKLNQAFFAPVTITHSLSQTITPLNTVNCNSGTTAVNYYYRAFNLSADFGISDEFNVSSAEFGVETFSGTALNAVINIYSTSGTFPAGFPGNATLQGTATYSVTTADIGNIISVPVSAAIPAGEKMIYELISEDGQASGQALFFGSNNLGETDASYIAAPLCGLSAPTPMASIGFPDVHMVMNVVGEEAEEEDGCLNNTSYGSGTAPSTGCASVTFSTCNFAGEYITMSGAVAGTSYTFMSSVSTDYYTVREGSYDGPVIAFGQQPLTATATASGNLYIHINTDADCGTQNSCRVTSVVCASCPGPADYCAVTSTNTTYGINNFVTTGGVDNINNSGTGPGQYTDFTSMFVSQEAGESVSFTIDPVSGTHGFGIWVDWGDNACFYDSGDHVYNSGAYISQATGTITVPAGTPAGDYRMRVVGNWLSQNPTPCGNLGSASYGEAEDYTFRVLGDGGGTGDPCDITFPHSNANGTGNTQTLLFADDFEIAADVTMTVSNVSFRMFNNIGVASTLAFYQDNGGQPAAAPIYTYSNLTPDSQTVVDSNFGMNIYDIAFTLPTSAELTEGVYWFALQTTVGTDNATNYWTIAGSGFGQPGKYSGDGGATWTTNSSGFNFSFTLDGTCETPGGGGQDCDALFTANAAAGTANGFAGVTFDIVNETSEEMTITGFKVPVSGSNSSFDMDIYYTTTASTNVGVHQDPSAWTLLESKTEIPAQNAVPFDPSTFSQVDLNNTLVLQPGQSKGIYVFVTDYSEGNTYRYSNGSYTETNGDLTILSNGFGSNATVFSSGFANRAFVGEVQYCTGEGGGGTGSPCSQEYMTGSDPLSSPNGAGITGGNRVANDVIVAANDSFTVQKVTVPVIYLNGSPTTFNVQFYEDDGSGTGGIGADLGPAISYGAGDYTSTFLGNWAGAYPLYMVELPIPDVLLENNSSSDAHFWIVIDGAVSTTGDFGYIVEFNHDGNPSHHTLQYLASSSSWIIYNSPTDMEGYMIVDGICENSGGGDGCLWTVHVWDDYWGDEVEWELRDSGGAVLISGGPYGSTYDDTATVTNEGPVTFWITNDGVIGDNTPNFEVSNENGIVISGSLTSPTTETFSDLSCDDGGGTGGACENPVLEINQDVDDTCMANFSQGGLAQSYKPLDSSAAGAGIKLRESSTGLNVTLSLWDGLPNAGGTMLTTGTTQTTGDVWVDVFWDEIVNVTVGDTYYIVIEGDTSLPCIAGSINNPYPDGMVFANAYGAWPNYDYTFRTYSCGEAPSGPCADKIVMDCGVTYTATLTPASGEWVNYTGVTYNYTGSEQVFEFTAPTTGSYTFELDQGANDADFMVMDACSNTANNVLGSGYWAGLGNQTINLTGGTTYYIIADLYEFAGGATTVSIKVNCPASGGYDCEDNKVPTGGLTNGYFFTNQLAVDIITNAAGFNIYGTKVNVFVDSGTDLNFSFNFYDDASGLPGASFDSASGTVLDSDYVGSAFGYDVYTFTVKFDHAISLAGNSTYWMEVISDGVAWESTTADIFGSQLAINNGSGWAIDDEEFVYEIICQELGLSDLTAYDFAYWPNPVTDMLNITSQKPVESVSVYNLVGQKVIDGIVLTNGQIDMSSLAPGAYVFRVILEGNKVETFKIIKK